MHPINTRTPPISPPTSPARVIATHVRHASLVIARSRSTRKPLHFVFAIIFVLVLLLLCAPSAKVVEHVRRSLDVDIPESPLAMPVVSPLRIIDGGADVEHQNDGDAESDLEHGLPPLPLENGVVSPTGAPGIQHRFEVMRKKSPSLRGHHLLPTCKRTLLFKMAGLHGFGSELLVLVRVAVLAEVFDYNLLIDSSGWNYGNWETFFEAPKLRCTPPPASTKRSQIKLARGVAAGDEAGLRSSWARFDHVVWSRRDLDGLDKATLTLFTSPSELQNLHQRDLLEMRSAALVAETDKRSAELVPHPFQDIFDRQSRRLAELWRVSGQTATMVRAARSELRTIMASGGPGMHGGDPGMHGGDESTPLVIGMHVRLGDKYLELSNIGPQALADRSATDSSRATSSLPRSVTFGLNNATITTYLEAAIALVDKIRASSLAFSAERPVLLIASDNPATASAFSKHQLGGTFNIVDTGTLKLGGVGSRSQRPSSHVFAADDGFNETTFNHLAPEIRLPIAQEFVRDVTLLDQVAHGVVMSASSNVGRMLALLAGEHKVAFGLVRSIDTRWFPTSHFA